MHLDFWQVFLKENVQNVKIVGVKHEKIICSELRLPESSGLKLTIEEYFTPKHK